MASSLGYNGGLTCALNVKDMEKSLAWYQDVLGFKMLYKMEEMGWCELATNIDRVNIGLSQVEDAGGKGGATMTFGVNDIDAARKELEGKNVRFDGPTQTVEGMVKLATFLDPDDNALMLFQELQ